MTNEITITKDATRVRVIPENAMETSVLNCMFNMGQAPQIVREGNGTIILQITHKGKTNE